MPGSQFVPPSFRIQFEAKEQAYHIICAAAGLAYTEKPYNTLK